MLIIQQYLLSSNGTSLACIPSTHALTVHESCLTTKIPGDIMPFEDIRLRMCNDCNVDTLVIANVSKTQITGLSKRLVEKRFFFTTIDSSGGLLQGSTNTLLIGILRERHHELMDLLRACCQRRITHVPTQTQMETFAHYSQPIIIEAQTGGATIHTIPVEHFEQF